MGYYYRITYNIDIMQAVALAGMHNFLSVFKTWNGCGYQIFWYALQYSCSNPSHNSAFSLLTTLSLHYK